MSVEIHQLIIKRVAQCLLIAENSLQRQFPVPTILFNQRGKIAGAARLQINQLRFNPILLSDNLDAFLHEVVPHEVCHLLVYQMFGKVRPHGKEWQTLMYNLFQLEGKTYHKMDISKVQGATFTYRCICGPVDLSLRRHNKVIKEKVHYHCRRCGERLSIADTAA